ncbi:Os10g0434801, partial [Oryza sativa Japonica Group]
LNSRRPLFPFFLSRHHREQPIFISSPRVHVLFLFLFFFPPCV